ncbi:AAA-like domain protein [Phycisphaerae bacterium RAS1]|nr:AAA-like domain protein [Phycisphaerae bacterium RAS1]
MRSPKNSKPLDLTGVQAFVEQTAGPALGALAPTGPTTRPPIELLQPVEPITFEQVWNEIPAALWWNILQRKRVNELCPNDPEPEWRRYQSLRRRSPAPWGGEVFVGLQYRLDGPKPEARWPIFVPRDVFRHHSYILGLPGTGKTSQALAQLLVQLAEEHTDKDGRNHPPPPLLIIDLKEGGDNYLRSLASHIAAERNQTLRFFSNDPDYESLRFDPLYCLRSIHYPLKKAETILKALSLIYKEGYGSDFFTAEQHTQLLKTLYNDRPETLRQLIEYVDRDTRGSKKNKDARGLYSALAPLQYSFHLVSAEENTAGDELVDLDRFYENGEVLYVHLNSRSQSIDAKVIGKLVVFALMETAAERKKEGTARQVFVAIDEFQRLAAQNIVEVLEDSRSLQVGFLLSHQSPESLRTRETDLYRMIADLCSYKQFLSLTSSNIVEQLQMVSGRRIERREGGSEARSKGTGTSEGSTSGSSSSSGDSRADTSGWFTSPTTTIGSSHTSGSASSQSSSTSKTEGRTDTKSWREEAIPGLTPEAIAAVNGTPLLSLIHVHATDVESATPLGGLPTLVLGLYPFTPTEAEGMTKARWERKSVETDAYYQKARARVPADAVNRLRRNNPKPGTPSSEAPSGAGDTRSVDVEDHKERRELRRRIRLLAANFVDHMLPEARTVKDLSKSWGVSHSEIGRLAAEFDVSATGAEDVVPARVVRAIRRKLPPAPKDDPEKDNGPPQGSVV